VAGEVVVPARPARVIQTLRPATLLGAASFYPGFTGAEIFRGDTRRLQCDLRHQRACLRREKSRMLLTDKNNYDIMPPIQMV
jgi:hypothetical protein